MQSVWYKTGDVLKIEKGKIGSFTTGSIVHVVNIEPARNQIERVVPLEPKDNGTKVRPFTKLNYRVVLERVGKTGKKRCTITTVPIYTIVNEQDFSNNEEYQSIAVVNKINSDTENLLEIDSLSFFYWVLCKIVFSNVIMSRRKKVVPERVAILRHLEMHIKYKTIYTIYEEINSPDSEMATKAMNSAVELFSNGNIRKKFIENIRLLESDSTLERHAYVEENINFLSKLLAPYITGKALRLEELLGIFKTIEKNIKTMSEQHKIITALLFLYSNLMNKKYEPNTYELQTIQNKVVNSLL